MEDSVKLIPFTLGHSLSLATSSPPRVFTISVSMGNPVCMLSISELARADVEAIFSEVTVADLSGGLWHIYLWPDLSHSSTEGKGSNSENSGPELTILIWLCKFSWVRRVLRGLLTRFILEKSFSQAAVEGEIVSKSCSKALMCLTESSFLCSMHMYIYCKGMICSLHGNLNLPFTRNWNDLFLS